MSTSHAMKMARLSRLEAIREREGNLEEALRLLKQASEHLRKADERALARQADNLAVDVESLL